MNRMVKHLHIENFKSIAKLDLDLDRFNIFIGENGCGKSNILEAIALGAASSANQLKKEVLVSRGIRVTRPETMRAMFSSSNAKKSVNISFTLSQKAKNGLKSNINSGNNIISEKIISFELQNRNKPYSDWFDKDKIDGMSEFSRYFMDVFFSSKEEAMDSNGNTSVEISKIKDMIKELEIDESEKKFTKDFLKRMFIDTYNKSIYDDTLAGFAIYSPENSYLRKFEDEERIQPLGNKGEGLFKLLKVFSDEKKQTSLNTLKKYLKMIDWFDDIEIPGQAFGGEKIINLKDRFIDEQIFIQQHNANEGFLFLLFYLSLLISNDTPKFFAVDNVETSFNPKLCSEVIKVFNELSREKNKQVILTTHNPHILDGLNLEDNEQRLYVIRRNSNGETIAKRIKPSRLSRKLSEAWMLGYIGGLPNNF